MRATVTTPATMREAEKKRQEIGADMRRLADNVIVPALLREYLAERDRDKELVTMEGPVPECRVASAKKETS